jgi:hypothetical protein
MKTTLKKINLLLLVLAVLPLVMAGSHEWSWREGRIDMRDAYVLLLYGAPDANPASWRGIARIGAPRGRVFPVQWLLNRQADENRCAVDAVVAELDFHLKAAADQPDPWSYALQHCDSTSNWHRGDVHWVCVSRVDLPAQP